MSHESRTGTIEVVIPAYNAGRYLRETLISVAAQTAPPSLVTVVDDASTDDTVAVALACSQELAGRITVQVVANEGPRGPSAARNTAIRRSEADWIALLDSDDLIAADHHAALLTAASGAGDVVLAFGDSRWFIDEAPAPRRTVVESFFGLSGVAAMEATLLADDSLTLGDATFPGLLRHGLFGTSACLFRRDAALRVGLFDERMMYAEDTDFFLRLALLGRFAFTRRIITCKRMHDASLSNTKNNMAFRRGTVFSYHKLATRTEPPLLNPSLQQAADRALTRAATAYLYAASRESLAEFIAAVRLARQCGRGRHAADPRHWLRLLVFGLPRLRLG